MYLHIYNIHTYIYICYTVYASCYVVRKVLRALALFFKLCRSADVKVQLSRYNIFTTTVRDITANTSILFSMPYFSKKKRLRTGYLLLRGTFGRTKKHMDLFWREVVFDNLSKVAPTVRNSWLYESGLMRLYYF